MNVRDSKGGQDFLQGSCLLSKDLSGLKVAVQGNNAHRASFVGVGSHEQVEGGQNRLSPSSFFERRLGWPRLWNNSKGLGESTGASQSIASANFQTRYRTLLCCIQMALSSI